MPSVGCYRTQTPPESASLHLSPLCPYPQHGEPNSVDQFLGTINFWPSLYSFTAYLYPTYEGDGADSVPLHLTDFIQNDTLWIHPCSVANSMTLYFLITIVSTYQSFLIHSSILGYLSWLCFELLWHQAFRCRLLGC